MARDINQIRIESILGGISDYQNFGTSDQFPFSCGIDPDINCNKDYYHSTDYQSNKASGFLSPRVQYSHASTSAQPMWIVTNPKNKDVFVYDSGGTIYTTRVYNEYATEVTTLASSVGGGSAYYDNYVYFATNSTVARFGPLNQDSPAINPDFWGNSLGKIGLSSTYYPNNYPNHILHRHSNGKLYFADVVGNQGVLHCISTKKTTIEGDTDDGSAYNAIDFPPGMWVTSIASYGSDIAVALYEGNVTQNSQQKAKVSFWDTTNPDNYYQITSTEFPDTFISAMVNSNGVLYVFSGPNPEIPNLYGEVSATKDTLLRSLYTRVSRFVGGYTFEQIAFIPGCVPPTHGGTDAILNKIIFNGTSDKFTFFDENNAEYDGGGNGSVFSIGSKLSGLSKSLNNVLAPIFDEDNLLPLGALKYVKDGYIDDGMFLGVKYYDTTSSDFRYGINKSYQIGSYDYRACVPHWQSQVFRIGSPFKITKVTLNQPIGDTNSYMFVSIFCDDRYFHYTKNTNGRGSIANNSHIPLRFENAFGTYSFFITITWITTQVDTWTPVDVALPIIIEYELLDD